MKTNLILGVIAGVLIAALLPNLLPTLILGLCIVLAALIIAEAIQQKEIVSLNIQNPVQGDKVEGEGMDERPLMGFDVSDED